MRRGPQVAQAAVPTARSMRWGPVAATAVLALAAVALLTHTHLAGGVGPIGAADRITALRVSAILLSLGAAFALDDPTGDVTATVPLPAVLRRAMRLGLACAAILPVWGLALAIAAQGLRERGGLPQLRVGLEALTLLVVVWGVAAAAERFVPERFGGLVAGPVLLTLVGVTLAAPFLPGHVRLYPDGPWDPQWGHAHALWLRALAVAAAVLYLFSRDPAHVRLRALPRALAP